MQQDRDSGQRRCPGSGGGCRGGRGEEGQRRWFLWSLPLAVVIPMLAIGSAFHLPGVVFPEGAALAAGLWTLDNPVWACSRVRLMTLPPACAALGVTLETVVPLPGGLSQVAALVLGLALLQVTRSRLAPCLSAAMFPVVFGVRGWVFPAAVTAICVVIAAGHAAGHRLAGPRTGAVAPALPPRWPVAIAGRYVLLGGAWILLVHPIPGAPAALLSPPLFVAGLEWAAGPPHAPSGGLRRWSLLTLAGLAGGAAALLSPALPSPVAAATAVAAVSAAAALLGDRHPPALAVCLIPFVLHRPNPLGFAASVAVTSAVLLLAGAALRRHVATERGDRRDAVGRACNGRAAVTRRGAGGSQTASW